MNVTFTFEKILSVFVCTFRFIKLVLVPIPLGCYHRFKVTEHTTFYHRERSCHTRDNERLGVVQSQYVQHL